MMFVKLYFRTSDYLSNFTCILGSIRLSLAKEIDVVVGYSDNTVSGRALDLEWNGR